MAIISGVTVDYSVSPRVITVPIPITTTLIQDMHDTIRDLEDRPASMAQPILVSSEGKTKFSATVGDESEIIMTLQDARWAFAARPGPSFVRCIVTGGSLAAVDSTGTTFIEPIEVTAFTQVNYKQAHSGTFVNEPDINLIKVLTLSHI